MSAPTLPEWARLYDEVAWNGSYRPAEPFGMCGHGCDHRQTAVVAVGPDDRRSELRTCVSAACRVNPAAQCRAWFTSHNLQWGPWRAVWVGREALPGPKV